jgi:hypothetical protein
MLMMVSSLIVGGAIGVSAQSRSSAWGSLRSTTLSAAR